MGEKIIVGAGPAGLVAAITLARRGYDVVVLEKFKTVGGKPERWPAVDVTPMNPEKLGRYLDIPLGEPQMRPVKSLTAHLYGEEIDFPVGKTSLYCVERGPRKTALDGYLLEIARDLGVKVEFEHPVQGQGELAALPPDTIVATGLYVESFDALRVPYVDAWCFGTKGTTERDAEAEIFFSSYTSDYAYWASLNGLYFTFVFQRGPIKASDFASYKAEVESALGVGLEDWFTSYGPIPTGSQSNPRLFASDKILAGTLAGAIEPFILFGLHGAMVSGKIAAMAVEDRYEALEEFKRCLWGWKWAFLQRKAFERTPLFARRLGVLGMNRFLHSMGEDFAARFMEIGFSSVPGYKRVKELA